MSVMKTSKDQAMM